MTEHDTIRITPGQASDTLALRSSSALAGCTDVDGDDAGLFITRLYPRLSSGEELLWRVLAWINGASGLPSYDDLYAGLDHINYRAAVAAITGTRVAS
ncbi:hypothetical protein [Jatrophihabitans sp.]|uniref:hypothetical protein n=1 Tax=Jatrophihabitans sp. TaxID=1932789 RepID=UPI0030C66A87|nr:hypothetical protein [Jatrophihabitans sp.]